MPRRRAIEDYSASELRQLLMEKSRAEREARLEAYRKAGRVIETAQPEAQEAPEPGSEVEEGYLPRSNRSKRRRRSGLDNFLFAVEIIAIVGLLFIIFNGVNLLRDLNQQVASAIEQPTLTPTPLITAVVLPGGHVPPVAGQENRFNEAEIPEHLRPLMQSYANLPVPTQSPQQARQIQIPAIGVNAPVVLGDGWEQLKKGVGQHIGTANPGDEGNLVLSAHNDIFSEIFRDLDKLKEGDEVIIITQDRSFTYLITGSQIVEPTRVDLLAHTSDSTITLISCYPYLVDNKRIVVQGILQ
ncbi:MAG TPA: class D sortase [Anaerolineaceae bacterium]|nr:class D sortase [Anaerolineaceae bacterium]